MIRGIMAEDESIINPSLHIDTDWKKQAHEEKRKLAEQESARSAPQTPAGSAGPAAGASAAGARGAGGPGGAGGASRGQRDLPPAGFGTLVQSILTQILYYLGDLSSRGGEPMLNLDMAKHQIDTLGVLEEKTKGNLSPDEQRLLDAALYEARMRYVAVAQQFIG